MSLTIIKAIILGVVQGLTEFLPVSSSGHLVIVEMLMSIDPDDPSVLLFDLAVHIGTLAAVLFVFRRELRRFLKHLMTSLGDLGRGKSPLQLYRRSASVRVLVLGVVASIPTGAIGVLFKDQFEQAFGSLTAVGCALMVTATLLLLTSRRRAKRGLRQFGLVDALVVGVAQGLAITPGISRSGSTICAAMLLGLRKRWAAQFSFFIATPAILGAALLKSLEVLSDVEPSTLPWVAIISGTITALLVGYAALKLLLLTIQRSKLAYFSTYCFIIGIGIVIWGLVG